MDQILSAAAAAFGVDASDCAPPRGGISAVCTASPIPEGPSILRLTPPNAEIDERWMRATLAFMDHLARGGVSVPAPRCSVRGELVEIIPGADGPYLAACFERAPGVLGEELPFSVWDGRHLRDLGPGGGAFHARARSYHAPARTGAPGLGPIRQLLQPGRTHRRPTAGAAPRRGLCRRAGFAARPAGLRADPCRFARRVTSCSNPKAGKSPYWISTTARVGGTPWISPCACTISACSPRRPIKMPSRADFLRSFLRGYLPAHPLDAGLDRAPAALPQTARDRHLCPGSDQAASAEADSWVGRFMQGRDERIAQARPFVEIDFGAEQALAAV